MTTRSPTRCWVAKAEIVRVPFGPRGYVRKEQLWDHLDELTDRLLARFRRAHSVPDVVHAHYADAGHVGRQISQLLGVPLVYTAHSHGRMKRARLLESGQKPSAIERRFRISRRIEAEELTFDQASLAIASTRQERDEQYGLYAACVPRRIAVVPPGVDLTRFAHDRRTEAARSVAPQVDRFLRNPRLPLVLTVCRPDEQKNLHGLVEAFATTPGLRDRANLAIVAGNRDDVEQLDEGPRRVLTRLLLDVDRYDLHGAVAIPKTHTREDVPGYFHLAAARRGVFVNPCFAENFGLTLVEAAASGLPVVATRNGGAREVVEDCRNGLLVDPTSTADIGRAINEAITEPRLWSKWHRSGLRAAERRYGWAGHAGQLVKQMQRLTRAKRKDRRKAMVAVSAAPARLLRVERALIADIDNTLLGDRASLASLTEWLAERSGAVAFGVATGRTLDSARKVLRRSGVPSPDIVVANVGTEIYYGRDLRRDDGWSRHISWQWRREALAEVLAEIDGLTPQPEANLGEFKLSYDVDAA